MNKIAIFSARVTFPYVSDLEKMVNEFLAKKQNCQIFSVQYQQMNPDFESVCIYYFEDTLPKTDAKN